MKNNLYNIEDITEHEIQIESDFKAFLQGCMTENLNHARHIETEIHTFTGIYMAVIAGVLAFDFSGRQGADFAAAVYIVMLLGGVLALMLVRRWYNAFDRHMVYAERAYYMLEALLLRGKHSQDVIEIWNWSKEELAALADLDPIFAFHHPRKKGSPRTRQLIVGFHLAILLCLVIILVKDLYF
ncbi:MAG: hypothetical protein IJL27_06435 [Firmicutes bacterium]|nr:hypothetical protein [Bacillota bacterium]